MQPQDYGTSMVDLSYIDGHFTKGYTIIGITINLTQNTGAKRALRQSLAVLVLCINRIIQ